MNCPVNRNQSLIFLTCCVVGYLSALCPNVFAADEDSVVASETKDTKSKVDKNSPSELSVPPLDHVVYPANRPSWLADVPNFDGEVDTWVVVTPACDTAREADELVAVLQRAAVASYVENQTGATAETIDFPIDDQWIESALVSKRYAGKFSAGDSPRYEEAVLLTFSPKVQAQIRVVGRNFEVRQRLGALGLCVTGLLGTLMLGSGVLSAIGRRVQRRQSQRTTSLA